ncbi:penicillin-binding protein 1B [Sinimarinibacterium sp. CAU 1509]|uniref:penicillin-binding protein 1B n=1 Tax=Sinimarinibacterium sp. CAU 1509 TaxID=2562283 RepID=UPI0010AB67AD|nr:penicillin-binding protein 1B [Sinimarinibacterium sp. CAU 1509]TJY62141.1 penicillin-binding protein 1B [Sinimarinibacterium sp. CAU 1509]
MARRNTKPKARATPRRSRFRWIAPLIVLISVAIVAFSVYLLGLDRQIRERFAGARWALPAQVYAAPMELYAGLSVGENELLHELGRLGYREDPRLATTGSYMPGRGRVDIHVRAFDFWDGPQAAMRLSVGFSGDTISSLRSLDGEASPAIARLDPMLIGSIYPQQGEDRVLLRIEDVPRLLPKGLVAVEDRHFYSHIGVSPRGILRAMVANLRAGRVVQGGSTITQQLIKNFFLSSRQTWARKINEAFMALLIERHYSKDQILEAYLNEVHLGQDGGRAVHGFGLGAQFYFNKPLSELQPQETALLVGLVKGPSYYNPRRNPQRAKERRDLVLGVFREEGLIDEAAYQRALLAPLGVDAGRTGGVERYPAFVDLVKRQLRGQYRDEDLTDEGLRIFTTLDPRAQEATERRIVETLPELERARKIPGGTLQAAAVVVSAEGGEVLALVGGREVRYSGFNRALDTQRPIGSLVKPFVYLTALSQPDRYTLVTPLADEAIELRLPNGQIWKPNNYDRKLHGPQPLYMALTESMNLPTVRLGLDIGLETVMRTLHAAGYSGDAPALPSMLLGALPIAPLEVAQMYATLAAGGFQAPLLAIREVQTKEGQPLSRYPIQVRQTLADAPVYLTGWALRQVVARGTGRGVHAALPANTVVAGKTGTTDDYRDSWFAGFGGDRVGVVWVGRDDNQPTGLSGSSGALPIWARIMNDIGVQSLDPIPPSDIDEVLVDPASGLRADDHCAGAETVPFARGSAPEGWAPCADARPFDPSSWWRSIFR